MFLQTQFRPYQCTQKAIQQGLFTFQIPDINYIPLPHTKFEKLCFTHRGQGKHFSGPYLGKRDRLLNQVLENFYFLILLLYPHLARMTLPSLFLTQGRSICSQMRIEKTQIQTPIDKVNAFLCFINLFGFVEGIGATIQNQSAQAWHCDLICYFFSLSSSSTYSSLVKQEFCTIGEGDIRKMSCNDFIQTCN